MNRVIAAYVSHPRVVVVTAVLLTLAALFAAVDPVKRAPRIAVDPALERLLPVDGEGRAVFERVQTVFGDTDAVIVAVRFDEVFTPDNLRAVEQISRAFADLADVRNVFSLATAPNLLADGEFIDVSSFTRQARDEPARVSGMFAELNNNPLYRGSLVSLDGKVTSFALSFTDVDDETFRRRDYPARIREIVRRHAGDRPVWVTGSPVIAAATANAMFHTLSFVLPVIFLLVVLLLGIAFRNLAATVGGALTIGMALVWTLADFALLGVPLNLITAIVPPLVITLCLAYAVHLLSDFFHAGSEDETNAERLLRTLKRGGPPLLLTGATTIAGLMALMINPLPAVRQFALLSSVGVAYSILLVLLFLPALLVLLGCRRAPPRTVAIYARIAGRLAAFATTHRVWIAVISLAVAAAAVWSSTGIRVGTEYIKSFRPDATVRTDFEAINEAFNGATLVSVLIETHVDDALTNPELMAEVEALEQWLREQPEVGAVVGYVDHLKLINQSLNEGEPEYYRLPDSAMAAKQLLVYGGSDAIRRSIDSRFRTALISVRIRSEGSIEIRDLVSRVERRLAVLPPPLFAQVTGSPVLATRTVDDIAEGQLESVLIALAVIYVMLALMFTSMRAALVAMLPNVLPIAAYFGLLGAWDITLNPTTSLIACIVLGIAVDDTIHFLARFNGDARAHGDERRAVDTALRAVLRPVTLTSIALCAGFLSFTGSELQNQVQFGLLAAATLVVAWITDITVTPALGSTVRIVTLWDLLRLDLGRNPQHTIPLLSGLSLRQARTFALLSNIETVPAGHRIITEGESARDIFVIIDGELVAWIERNSEHRRLSTMGRGATMGEAGYFGQKRTANVDAVEDSRLLRFDSQDLEKLRRRHPRIAATIFRNLNRIQAERIARMTAMLQ